MSFEWIASSYLATHLCIPRTADEQRAASGASKAALVPRRGGMANRGWGSRLGHRAILCLVRAHRCGRREGRSDCRNNSDRVARAERALDRSIEEQPKELDPLFSPPVVGGSTSGASTAGGSKGRSEGSNMLHPIPKSRAAVTISVARGRLRARSPDAAPPRRARVRCTRRSRAADRDAAFRRTQSVAPTGSPPRPRAPASPRPRR
jgi:hypothetical protein